MNLDWKIKVLAVLVVTAGIRLGYIYYERSQPAVGRQPQTTGSSYRITSDDYVSSHKIYAYDMDTAKSEMAGKTVWVRGGMRIPYYAYRAAARHADSRHELGVLGPLEKLEIKSVSRQEPARPGAGRQLLAEFVRPGSPVEFALPIGEESNGNFHFFVNDEFYLDDPHELFKHWPPELWKAVDHHQIMPGMTELQAGFALGAIVKATAGDIGNRTLSYAYGGKPVTVTFVDNRVVQTAAGN